VTCVLPARAKLGECPVWDERLGRLYWVDIDGRRVHRFDPATGDDEERSLPGRPGSIAMTADSDRLLVAMEHLLVWLEWESGEVTPWFELEEERPGVRLNDGRCDPAGRFWVGSMHVPSSAHRFAGMLHRIEPDGVVATTRREVGVANGLAFSPDGRTMYFADTLRDTVWSYRYDADSGTTSNEQVFIDFTGLPGRPDGGCVDEAGCYWIACVYGWAVARVTPDGTVDRVIEVPVEKPTMPAFGGPGLETLFVTSIGVRDGDAPTPGQHEPGGLFAVTPGVRGIPEPVFTG
jgi:L-arabinonolactonase